MNVNQIMQ